MVVRGEEEEGAGVTRGLETWLMNPEAGTALVRRGEDEDGDPAFGTVVVDTT